MSRDRWWETGGQPPLKPAQRAHNKAGFWMDPDLGFKIKIAASVILVIACLGAFGFGGGVVGLLAAVFLTKPTSKHQRW